MSLPADEITETRPAVPLCHLLGGPNEPKPIPGPRVDGGGLLSFRARRGGGRARSDRHPGTHRLDSRAPDDPLRDQGRQLDRRHGERPHQERGRGGRERKDHRRRRRSRRARGGAGHRSFVADPSPRVHRRPRPSLWARHRRRVRLAEQDGPRPPRRERDPRRAQRAADAGGRVHDRPHGRRRRLQRPRAAEHDPRRRRSRAPDPGSGSRDRHHGRALRHEWLQAGGRGRDARDRRGGRRRRDRQSRAPSGEARRRRHQVLRRGASSRRGTRPASSSTRTRR